MSINRLNGLIEEYICDLPNIDLITQITEEKVDAYQKHVRYYYENEEFINEVKKLQDEIANLPKRWQTNESAIKEYQDNPDFYRQEVVEAMANFEVNNENSLFKVYHHIKKMILGEGTAYYEANEEYNSNIRRLIVGYEGENTLIERLKTGLATSKQRILENVNINNNEHDLIIVGKKGIFTIEIKNHKTHMHWDVNGDFYEGRKNRYTGEIEYEKIDHLKDPYHQALLHRNSLYEMLKQIGDCEVQNYVVLCNWLKEPTSADKTILKRVKLLNAFVEEYSQYPDILTDEQVELVCQFLEKNSTKDKKFPLQDIAKINKITADFILSHNLRYEDVVKPEYMKINNIIQSEWIDKKCYLFMRIKNFELEHEDNPFDIRGIESDLIQPFEFGRWPVSFFVIAGLIVGYYYDKYLLSLGVSLLIWFFIVIFVNNGRQYIFEASGYEMSGSRKRFIFQTDSALGAMGKKSVLLRQLDLLTEQEKKEEAEAKTVIEDFVREYSSFHETFAKLKELRWKCLLP